MQTRERPTTTAREAKSSRWPVAVFIGGIVVALVLVAMLRGGGSDSATAPVADEASTIVPSPTTVPVPATLQESDVVTSEVPGLSEEVVAAFFTSDPEALTDLRWNPIADPALLLDAQQWAAGANYEVVDSSCTQQRTGLDVCEVTVRHDFGQALGYQSVVSFIIGSVEGEISEASFREPDPILHELFAWAQTAYPEEFGHDGHCLGETSPGECAAAYARVAGEFALTEEYVAP